MSISQFNFIRYISGTLVVSHVMNYMNWSVFSLYCFSTRLLIAPLERSMKALPASSCLTFVSLNFDLASSYVSSLVEVRPLLV